MLKSFKQIRNHLILLFVSFSIGIIANCQVDSTEGNNKDIENQLVTSFAKKNLPLDYFVQFDWENIKKAKGKDTITGWNVKPFIKKDSMIISIFLRAEKNNPVDIMEIKITSTVREMSKITGFNLREEIGKGRAMPLELVLFSYIKNTSQIIVAPDPGKTFNKQEYDEVKKTDPEKASQMLPNILIYGGGIPPHKRIYVKFDTFLPGSNTEAYILIEEL
jgi:hypothetical protein